MERLTRITITLHDCRQWLDNTTALTWCGKRLTMTPATTGPADHARDTGIATEVSCPLCQAAQIIDATGIRLPPARRHGARRSTDQPTFEGAESW